MSHRGCGTVLAHQSPVGHPRPGTKAVGGHLALQAGAGTGKTTTLELLARTTKRCGRYLAYNRAIAQDARARFPSTVTCKTAHALAYAATGHRHTHRPAWQTGQALGITKAIRVGERDLSPKALSYATPRTVARFRHTANPALTRNHVPHLRGLEDRELHAELGAHIVLFARKARADLQHPEDGRERLELLRPPRSHGATARPR